MRDAEDIITLLTDYIKEDIGGGVTRINDLINKENTKKGDDLLPNINSNILLGQGLKEIQTQKVGFLNLRINPDFEAITNYDNAAIIYIIEISYIVKSPFNNKVFLRLLRMTTVLKTLMNSFHRDNQGEPGFAKGEITGLFTPENVLLGNSSLLAVQSGLNYNITIF